MPLIKEHRCARCGMHVHSLDLRCGKFSKLLAPKSSKKACPVEVSHAEKRTIREEHKSWLIHWYLFEGSSAGQAAS